MSKIEQTTFDTLSIAHNGEWCNVMWRQVGGSGGRYRVIIISSYGSWSYYFVTGSHSFAGWLAHLNSDYLGQKLMEENFKVFDGKASFADVHDQIDWDDANDYPAHDEPDEWTAELFLMLLYSQDIDTCEAVRRKPCSTWTSFWEYLWEPAVIPALLEVSANELEAA